MRQIHVGAWLVVTCSTLAACSGEKFAPTEESSVATSSGGSASGKISGGSAGRASGGASSGGTGTVSGGKPGFGGNASAGSSAAGTPSSGGNGNSGGDDDGPECAFGAVKFRMLPGPDVAHDYLCDAGCGTGWLTITDQVGATAFSIFSSCGTVSCGTCEAQPCAAAACLPTPLTGEGSELTWDGTYLAADTCGANMACQRQSCVPAGKYKAKACAAISAGNSPNGAGCMPKDEVLCAEAEFQFPGPSEVKLILK